MSTDTGEEDCVLINNTGKELTVQYADAICSLFPGIAGFKNIASELQSFKVFIVTG